MLDYNEKSLSLIAAFNQQFPNESRAQCDKRAFLDDDFLQLRSSMKNSRLRVVQCDRIAELTTKKPNATIEARCNQMPQCILEALIVEIGMVEDVEEKISAYSEALMISLIYTVMASNILLLLTFLCILKMPIIRSNLQKPIGL